MISQTTHKTMNSLRQVSKDVAKNLALASAVVSKTPTKSFCAKQRVIAWQFQNTMNLALRNKHHLSPRETGFPIWRCHKLGDGLQPISSKTAEISKTKKAKPQVAKTDKFREAKRKNKRTNNKQTN